MVTTPNGAAAPTVGPAADRIAELPEGAPADVWIDQDACTGDGICVTHAREVFELDIDGLAYVKGEDGELRQARGEAVRVPAPLLLDVLVSARECPGECIYVRSAGS